MTVVMKVQLFSCTMLRVAGSKPGIGVSCDLQSQLLIEEVLIKHQAEQKKLSRLERNVRKQRS